MYGFSYEPNFDTKSIKPGHLISVEYATGGHIQSGCIESVTEKSLTYFTFEDDKQIKKTIYIEELNKTITKILFAHDLFKQEQQKEKKAFSKEKEYNTPPFTDTFGGPFKLDLEKIGKLTQLLGNNPSLGKGNQILEELMKNSPLSSIFSNPNTPNSQKEKSSLSVDELIISMKDQDPETIANVLQDLSIEDQSKLLYSLSADRLMAVKALVKNREQTKTQEPFLNPSDMIEKLLNSPSSTGNKLPDLKNMIEGLFGFIDEQLPKDDNDDNDDNKDNKPKK